VPVAAAPTASCGALPVTDDWAVPTPGSALLRSPLAVVSTVLQAAGICVPAQGPGRRFRIFAVSQPLAATGAATSEAIPLVMQHTMSAITTYYVSCAT